MCRSWVPCGGLQHVQRHALVPPCNVSKPQYRGTIITLASSCSNRVMQVTAHHCRKQRCCARQCMLPWCRGWLPGSCPHNDYSVSAERASSACRIPFCSMCVEKVMGRQPPDWGCGEHDLRTQCLSNHADQCRYDPRQTRSAYSVMTACGARAQRECKLRVDSHQDDHVVEACWRLH